MPSAPAAGAVRAARKAARGTQQGVDGNLSGALRDTYFTPSKKCCQRCKYVFLDGPLRGRCCGIRPVPGKIVPGRDTTRSGMERKRTTVRDLRRTNRSTVLSRLYLAGPLSR